MAGILGFNAKLYVEISATDTLVPHVGDVTLARKDDEANVTTRSDGGFKTFASGLRELGVSFFLQKRKANTVYNAIRDAYRNRTDIVVTVCDGAIATAGTDKCRFTGAVLEFSEEQKLGNAIGHNVTIKPTWSDTIPAESTAS